MMATARVPLSSSPPLLPSQPRLSSPFTASSPSSPAASPILITVHVSHTGSSLSLSLSASLSVSALQAELSQQLHLHPNDQLLLTKTGVALLPSSLLSSYAAPTAAEAEEKAGQEQRLPVWLYQRQLLSSSGLSPPSLPVPPSYPLSSLHLSFSLPPAPPSPSPSSLPHLQSCSSLLLRALPEYVRLFSLHELHAQAYIEHIDILSKKSLQAIAALSSLSTSLLPLALHLSGSLSALSALLSSLSSHCASLSLRTASALSSLPAALASLPSPVCDALDYEGIKSRAALVSRERERMQSRLDGVSARKHQLEEALQDLRRDASGGRWEEERRVMERWTAELRHQCVTWLTDIIAHRDDAFAFVHRVDAALGASHELQQLERDSRAKLAQLEDWNRRDREDKVEHLRSLLLTFQTTAASLLPPAVLSPLSSSLLTASHVLHGVTEEEAALVLVQEYCSRWQDGVLMLERVSRAGDSWVRGVEETLRRRRRWRRRRREVEDVVQGWKQEEQDERQRRAAFWSQYGVNLPPQLLRGLKEEGGWLRVELRDEERQLPTVTDDDIRAAREKKAATEERKEETKVSAEAAAGSHGSDGEEEETMTERLLRLTQENRQLKAQMQQLASIPPPLPPSAAAMTALQEEVSRLKSQLLVLSPPSSPSSSSASVPRVLYDDALKNSASLEQALASAQHELEAAREHLTGQEAHLGWLSTRLQTAVKAEREATRRATAAEEEVTDWKGRAYERVAVSDLAINDMVMAVADHRPPQPARLAPSPTGSSDAASTQPSPSSSPPIYRVRNVENRQIFLSSDSVNALRERAAAAAAASSTAAYSALPDWVVGHIVLIDCRRAGSRGSREPEVLGVKEGEEYWLVTVELVDWSLRTKGREEKEERKRGKDKEEAQAEADEDSRVLALQAAAAATTGISRPQQQQSQQPAAARSDVAAPSISSHRSCSAVQQLDAIILASP